MKVNCIYHRDQQITNFCRDQNCLMPLCPSCIAEHTSYHEEDRSRPQYTSIFEAQSEVHAQIANCIQCIEADKKRNEKLLISIQTVPDRIHEKIQVAKQMALEAVEEAFINLERDVLQKLEESHEQKELYSIDKTKKLDKQILTQLDQLYSLQDGFKSDRGLSNLIYFLREKQEEVENFHTKMSTYLNSNENYYPTIEINSDAFYSLNALISRAIKISSSKKILGESNLRKSSTVKKKEVQSSHQKNNISSKLRDNYVPLIQSQIGSYSPSRATYSPYKSRMRSGQTTKTKYDGDYEKLSRKVSEVREENQRLSRYLNDH